MRKARALRGSSRECLSLFAEFHESCERYVATSLELMLLVETQTANLKHHHGANVSDDEQCTASQRSSEKNMHVLRVTF